jgi:hypothetical protein
VGWSSGDGVHDRRGAGRERVAEFFIKAENIESSSGGHLGHGGRRETGVLVVRRSWGWCE